MYSALGDSSSQRSTAMLIAVREISDVGLFRLPDKAIQAEIESAAPDRRRRIAIAVAEAAIAA